MRGEVYALWVPEDPLLRDSAALKLAKRPLGITELAIDGGGNLSFDPAPFEGLLAEGEELHVVILWPDLAKNEAKND